MKLRIVWNYPALSTFYDLRIHEATAVDRAVIHFAETSEGRLTKVGPHHHLAAGSHNAVLDVDLDAGTVTVLRIYRVRSRP